jgi:hypothetical protein
MTTDPATEDLGPLERKHLQYAKFRAVAGGTEVTTTHWHIALANGLGWAFDGMDSMVFSLVAPLVISEFALDLPNYRSGVQIALFVGIAGLYFLAVARRPVWAAQPAGDLHRLVLVADADRGAGTELCYLCRRALGGELRAEW